MERRVTYSFVGGEVDMESFIAILATGVVALLKSRANDDEELRQKEINDILAKSDAALRETI